MKLTFFFLSLFLLSCSKSNDEKNSTLRITFNRSGSYLPMSVDPVKKVSKLATPSWLSGSFSTSGSIKCLGVMVTYQGVFNGTCGNTASATYFDVTDMEGTLDVSSGGTDSLNISLFSNIETTIRIVGFAGSGNCPDIFSINNDDFSNFQAPQVVYEETTSFDPGIQELNVSVNATSIANGIQFDDCFGDLFNFDTSGASNSSLPVTSGLELWIDPSESTSVFDGTACTGNTPGAGVDIHCISDLSGNGNDINAGAMFPSYEPTGINTLGAFRIDTAGEYFITNLLPSAYTAYSIFAVVHPGGSMPNFQTIMGAYSADDSDESTFFFAGGGSPYNVPALQHGATNVQSTAINTPPATASLVYMGTDGTSNVAFGDNTQDEVLATSTASLTSIPYFIGATNDGSSYVVPTTDMLFGEILFYNRFLTNTERIQVRDYLINKWGL